MGAPCFSLSSLLLVIAIAGLFFLGDSKTYWGDIEALKELRKGVDSGSVAPGSCLSSWDFAVDPCDSLFGERFTCGFRCDVVVSGAGRVNEITLDQAGYAGSLSSDSWNLPYLETLDLSGNFFSGSVPASLSNLTRLRRLGLSRNSFSGDIPASTGLMYSPAELYLDGNGFEGAVPASFNGLTRLKRLELQGNKLSGEFPDLGSLKNLYLLDATGNAISGEIPTLPSSLVEISMRNNSLDGSIPDAIKNLSFLQVLDLSYNRLNGSVPSFFFDHPTLQQLTLSNNRFDSIEVPATPAAGSQLIALDLSYNDLRGLLPSFLALMTKLSALSLENNKFTGMIPTQYALKAAAPGTGESAFERLMLGGNYLFGPIPAPLMQLKSDAATVRLVDNCLYRCPSTFSFCQGGEQKSLMECKRFGPMIP